MKQLLALLFSVVLLASCKKEGVESGPPEIALLSAGPNAVVQFEDRVVLRFSYKDPDGDLGQDDPMHTHCG